MNIENAYERICKGFGEIIPLSQKEKFVFKELEFAGIKDDFHFWIGKRVLAAVLAALIGLLFPWTAGKFFGIIDFETAPLIVPVAYSIFLAALFLLLVIVSFYLHLYYQLEGRVTLVEDILPDFLMLVASNINAGMTPTAAFRGATRKEFGPLSEEIKAATAKSLGTESFTESLRELSKKIKSKTLEETVDFFGQSLRSGGHLAKLLETSANDLRQTQELKRELASSTRMYIIFVGFIVVIATPVLLGVSVQFLKMVTAIQAQNPLSSELGTTTVAFLSTELRISPQFMQTTAYLLLLVNSILSSLFIGMLGSGKAKLGLKNFPFLLFFSIATFSIATALLEKFLETSGF